MPAIIYQKTPGALIPQPGRTVATFTSGLVRVDQTFVCATTDEEKHRAALVVNGDFPGDSAPSLTGLKIFPEPQEIRRGDGFTEFKISGYGATTEDGRNLKYSQRIYSHTFVHDVLDPDYSSSPLFGTGSLTVIFILQDIRGEIVGSLASLRVPLEELDVVSMYASAGWTVESVKNNFISSESIGNIFATFRWNTSNVDGSFNRVRLTVQVSQVGWTIESSRSYGDIGEFVVTGTREIRPLDLIDLEAV